MYQVTKIIHFCYGHRLRNYEGKCRHLHGHNAKVEIELTSSKLDKRGMVKDFEDIKKTIQRWIDDTLDHTMLLGKNDPLSKILASHGERHYLMNQNPTAEAIAKHIFDYAKRAHFPVTSVKVWETPQSFATYKK